VIVEDARARAQHNHGTRGDCSGFTIGRSRCLGVSLLGLLQRRGHVGLDVFAPDIRREILGLHRPLGCGSCSCVVQANAKLREGVAESFPADGGHGRISFTARGKTLLNGSLTRRRHLFKPLRGSLRCPAVAASFRIILFGGRLFGLIRRVARAFRLGQGFARPLIGL